jgi:hypothetical protein
MADAGGRLMQYHVGPVPSMEGMDHVESVQSKVVPMRH